MKISPRRPDHLCLLDREELVGQECLDSRSDLVTRSAVGGGQDPGQLTEGDDRDQTPISLLVTSLQELAGEIGLRLVVLNQ